MYVVYLNTLIYAFCFIFWNSQQGGEDDFICCKDKIDRMLDKLNLNIVYFESGREDGRIKFIGRVDQYGGEYLRVIMLKYNFFYIQQGQKITILAPECVIPYVVCIVCLLLVIPYMLFLEEMLPLPHHVRLLQGCVYLRYYDDQVYSVQIDVFEDYIQVL
eukprot:TRINITY_DN1730_c0_g2_i1.p2 TRINITY_DN1730_c0_g2~~TRINITY_DN1730_c0_g2_i1.p2  ORF type:complete len:160 (+),score=7.40 TRINITY_DN1730_c0_g2_i1:881-1360(+)